MLAVAFLFPMVLLGAFAAAGPVVIHFILRTRPRRVVFPPLRFVRKTHRAQVGKLKLKHLLLLMMRMAAVALVAVLLARPRVLGGQLADDEQAPAAAVFVVDTSASMQYRYHERSALDTGKRLGEEVIRAMAPGSAVAVLTTARPAAPATFHGDLRLAAQQLADVPAGFGHDALAPAVARAEALLARCEQPRKELYVITDMTAEAWREGSGAAREGDLAYVVLNCRRGEDLNVSIERAEPSASAASVGEEIALDVTVRSARAGGEVAVRVEADGQAVARRTVPLSPGQPAAVRVLLRPARQGVLHGRVVLEYADPLEADNVRYFTVQVGRPGRMLVVRQAVALGPAGQTAFLMANAISPPTATGAGWLERRTTTASRLDTEPLADYDLVLLADVAAVGEPQWGHLESFVRGGGGLWIVLGPLASPEAYNSPAAQRVVPLALGPAEAVDPPAAWQTDPAPDPLLPPIREEGGADLTGVLCERRFAARPAAPDARVVLRYADGVPAVAARRLDAGCVLLWNFSPARTWSNLARRAELPILARHAARALTAADAARTAALWGQEVSVPAPRSMPGAVATVRHGDEQAERPVLLDLARRAVVLTGDRLGPWTVRFADAERSVAAGFSVNVDPAESRLAPAGREIEDLFPPGSLRVADDVDQLRRQQQQARQPLDLAAPLLLVLLALVVGESFFANRFYRPADAPAG